MKVAAQMTTWTAGGHTRKNSAKSWPGPTELTTSQQGSGHSPEPEGGPLSEAQPEAPVHTKQR